MRAVALALALTVGALAFSGCGSSQKVQQARVGAGAARAEQLREIKVAQTTGPWLSIFPAHPSTSTCLIPAGGLTALQLPGRCETTIRSAATRHEPLRIVPFT